MSVVTVDQETGEIIDIDGPLPDEPRSLTEYHPEPRGLARATDPADMIAMASKMASALADIVQRQGLFATIQGKRYPTVEAWATIARMDNVVAREADRPVRHDDGSYEAFVELVRLGDMAVIGRASAVCGAPDDRPWSTRAEYARRSMAVTRATSRAFRQHYSWIMSLAGYEPTPSEEMPYHAPDGASSSVVAAPPSAVPVRTGPTAGPASFTGKVQRGAPPVDLELRATPDGDAFGFALVMGTRRVQVIAEDALASALAVLADSLSGIEATVTGTLEMVPWDKDGKAMPPFKRLYLARIETSDFTLPASPNDDDAELDALVA